MDEKPYNEIASGDYFIREFSPDVDFDDLKWHRDYEDRLVEPLAPNDWQYQEDNKLPVTIDKTIFIPKGLWHRVIKGTTPLKIKLIKFSENQ
jgi:hypothetical protein